ncbi:hypothetical protein PPL_00985 [Heterostelium album PN500]|uniref:Uncharacterized protein n=1 Tax=Heterostelium pallidum (strain ATCC 26659 / Pp 5 / PN500) TaxID=670386 RepID=D3AXS8_HETP5|nr:hypothetical protein PPL_00985 [Heterostelium album PN500]EFA85755.1 hypothetical protein PPL_00985 [Heterostelium album PN500]|eukprot:XP_020437861.1 hypothetical protein PPL_00985 [Heterostelium album PN500]
MMLSSKISSLNKTTVTSVTNVLYRSLSTSSESAANLTNSFNNRDKKILIHGSDVAGVSLALFLKKKGISSELVDTGSRLDRGILISANASKALKQNGVFESIYRKGKDVTSSIVTSKDGEIYGSCNFEKYDPILPFALTEATFVETLLQECLSTPQSGEGSVKLRKGDQRLTLSLPKQQQQQQGQQQKIYVGYSETSKAAYDLVVGSEGYGQTSDLLSTSPVRNYLLKDASVPQTTQYAEQLYHFKTVINKPSLFPAIVHQQFATEKRLLTFPLPNDRLAISGSFKRPLNQIGEPENARNKIFNTFTDFEDIGAHTVISFLESAPENLKLEKSDQHRLQSYISSTGNIVAISDAADKLASGSFESNFIGIEDAYRLSEMLSQSPESISQILESFNRDRQQRMKLILAAIDQQEKVVYKGGWQVRTLGKYYLKFYYSQRQQAKRLRELRK